MKNKLKKTANKIAKPIVKQGKKLPPSAEIGVGAVLAGVPIPEPVSETATNIAGIALVADGVRRIKRKKK